MLKGIKKFYNICPLEMVKGIKKFITLSTGLWNAVLYGTERYWTPD